MVYTVEIIHTVFVGDIGLTAKDIDNGRVDLLQFRLRRHGHSTHSTTGILAVEESAVAHHQSLDARVGTVIECLQTAARHTCGSDVLHVDLLVIWRTRISILRNHPVNRFYLLLGG